VPFLFSLALFLPGVRAVTAGAGAVEKGSDLDEGIAIRVDPAVELFSTIHRLAEFFKEFAASL
jgi:hypothetical protein